MKQVIGLGKWLFAIPFLIFGFFHFMGADAMAEMAPGGAPMVYFTGLCLVAAAVSIFIGKYDKLAATLLAVMLLLFILIVHAPAVAGGDQMAMMSLLKDMGLIGGALMYAGAYAKDHSVIG